MLNTNYKFGEVYKLSNQIEAADDKVQFKHILATENGGIVLAAFKAGQNLDTHTAPAELMVTVLEGEIVFTVSDKENTLKAGDFLLVGAGVPHSVLAKADSKMMLVKVKA